MWRGESYPPVGGISSSIDSPIGHFEEPDALSNHPASKSRRVHTLERQIPNVPKIPRGGMVGTDFYIFQRKSDLGSVQVF